MDEIDEMGDELFEILSESCEDLLHQVTDVGVRLRKPVTPEVRQGNVGGDMIATDIKLIDKCIDALKKVSVNQTDEKDAPVYGGSPHQLPSIFTKMTERPEASVIKPPTKTYSDEGHGRKPRRYMAGVPNRRAIKRMILGHVELAWSQMKPTLIHGNATRGRLNEVVSHLRQFISMLDVMHVRELDHELYAKLMKDVYQVTLDRIKFAMIKLPQLRMGVTRSIATEGSSRLEVRELLKLSEDVLNMVIKQNSQYGTTKRH